MVFKGIIIIVIMDFSMYIQSKNVQYFWLSKCTLFDSCSYYIFRFVALSSRSLR